MEEDVRARLDSLERRLAAECGKRAAAEEKVRRLSEELAGFREHADRVRSLYGVMKKYGELERKLSRVQESEKYVMRMSAKVDSMFAELDRRLPAILEVEEKTRAMQMAAGHVSRSSGAGEQLQKLEARVGRIESALDGPAKKIGVLGRSVVDIDGKLDSVYRVGRRISAVESRVDSLEGVVGKERSPDAVESIKKAVAEAIALVDSGRILAASEAYMRIFDEYVKLREHDKSCAEAAYPSVYSLHRRIELNNLG